MSDLPNHHDLSTSLAGLQSTCTIIKLDITNRKNDLASLLHCYQTLPDDEVLLSHNSKQRLASMIKHLICRHQVLFNALMELADCTSHLEHDTLASRRERAQEEWVVEGDKLGLLFYQAKSYLDREQVWRLRSESPFEWRRM